MVLVYDCCPTSTSFLLSYLLPDTSGRFVSKTRRKSGATIAIVDILKITGFKWTNFSISKYVASHWHFTFVMHVTDLRVVIFITFTFLRNIFTFQLFISEGVISVPPPWHELPLIGLVNVYTYKCLILSLPHALKIKHFFFLNLNLSTFAACSRPYTQWKQNCNSQIQTAILRALSQVHNTKMSILGVPPSPF